jgi:hypothetical protein
MIRMSKEEGELFELRLRDGWFVHPVSLEKYIIYKKRRTYMVTTPEKLLEFVKEKNVKWIDLQFMGNISRSGSI